MGRYIERVENLARLIAVTENFSETTAGESDWSPLLKVHRDTEAFRESGKSETPLNIARHYLIDADNPHSIKNALRMTRKNARSMRHIISTEIWRQLNMFHKDVEALNDRAITLRKLDSLCQTIRYSCHTHFGLVDGTWYRDEAWLFNQLGVALERADQTTRLLDIKYFQLENADTGEIEQPDTVWWNTLLRSASGYHAFRRRHSVDLDPADAARFLLFDRGFPRSVYVASSHALAILEMLEESFGLENGEAISDARMELNSVLGEPPRPLEGAALHKYLDSIQLALIALSNGIIERYFNPD